MATGKKAAKKGGRPKLSKGQHRVQKTITLDPMIAQLTAKDERANGLSLSRIVERVLTIRYKAMGWLPDDTPAPRTVASRRAKAVKQEKSGQENEAAGKKGQYRDEAQEILLTRLSRLPLPMESDDLEN